MSEQINQKLQKAYLELQKAIDEKKTKEMWNQFKIIDNLLSDKPSILLFDLYKLGYYCKINSKN